MKKLLILFFLLNVVTASAQNYQCLQYGPVHYFINKYGYLRGIRIDSVKTSSDTTIFYPFKTQRGLEWASDTPAFVGGSWVGTIIHQYGNGITMFDNYWGNHTVLETGDSVGQTWLFYSDASSVYYTATVTNIDTMTFSAVNDTVKTIIVRAYKDSLHHISDHANDLSIKISKNHGFVRAIDFICSLTISQEIQVLIILITI